MTKKVQVLLNCFVTIATTSVSPHPVLVSKYPMHYFFLHVRLEVINRCYLQVSGRNWLSYQLVKTQTSQPKYFLQDQLRLPRPDKNSNMNCFIWKIEDRLPELQFNPVDLDPKGGGSKFVRLIECPRYSKP